MTDLQDDGLMAAKARLIMQLQSLAIQDAAVLSAIERVPRELFFATLCALMHAKCLIAYCAWSNHQPALCHREVIDWPHSPCNIVYWKLAPEQAIRHVCCPILRGASIRLNASGPYFVDAEQRIGQCRLTNISLRHADGQRGWPEAAPFDRIITTCQSEDVPSHLIDQLKEGGIFIGYWTSWARNITTDKKTCLWAGARYDNGRSVCSHARRYRINMMKRRYIAHSSLRLGGLVLLLSVLSACQVPDVSLPKLSLTRETPALLKWGLAVSSGCQFRPIAYCPYWLVTRFTALPHAIRSHRNH